MFLMFGLYNALKFQDVLKIVVSIFVFRYFGFDFDFVPALASLASVEYRR